MTLQGQNDQATRSRYRDLIEVATELFSIHGYDGTTVRMISDRMGIKSGSLYSHISGKADILREIIIYIATEVYERGKTTLDNHADDPPPVRLRQLCISHFQTLHDYKPAVDVYFGDWKKLPEEDREQIVALRTRYEDLFLRTLKDGVASGDFKDIDIGWTLYVLLGALNWSYQWYQPGGRLAPSELAEELVDVVFVGLLTQPTDVPRGRVRSRPIRD